MKTSVVKNISEKSLEYLIVRSTDPFLNETERDVYIKSLLKKIDEQLEAPEIIFKLISHKLLSPDQCEALNTLKVLDELVRYGGKRVANEIGKFKFLNNFIRILSPKYLGLQSSKKMKQKSIELLFLWKISLRHLEKIYEVYELLKQQNIIEEDPQLSIDITFNTFEKCAPRLASFEDEEKAQLLAQLLHSKRIEDLQAANRMIKTMVKSEDKKNEQLHKRKEVLDVASSRAELLLSMLKVQKNQISIFEFEPNLSLNSIDVSSKNYLEMKELFHALIAFRPMLFRYASEAADNNENGLLSEILLINDRLNIAVQNFKKHFIELKNKSNDDLITIDDTIKLNDVNFDKNYEKEQPSCSKECNYENLLNSNFVNDENILCSPSLSKKNKFFNTNNILTQNSPSNVNNKPSLIFDDLNKRYNETNIDLMNNKLMNLNLISQTKNNEILPFEKSYDNIFSLKNTEVNINDLDIISTIEPKVLYHKHQIQAILYYASLSNNFNTKKIELSEIKNMFFYIVIINSANPLPITNISLNMSANNSLINSKLLESNCLNTSLNGFHPAAPVQTISRIFIIFSLIKNFKASIKFSLSYNIGLNQYNHNEIFSLLI